MYCRKKQQHVLRLQNAGHLLLATAEPSSQQGNHRRDVLSGCMLRNEITMYNQTRRKTVLPLAQAWRGTNPCFLLM
jgi:hypothetical protein